MNPLPVAGALRGWQPDPFRRHELRFRDGDAWTEHVSDLGVAGIDTVPVAHLAPSRPPDRTAGAESPPTLPGAQVRVVPTSSADPVGLFDALVLLVEDESIATSGPFGREHLVRDEHGRPIAIVRVGLESPGARALRMLTTDVVAEVTAIEAFDAAGGPLLSLERAARRLKPIITVRSGDGAVVGQLVPRRLLSGIQYLLVADGAAQAMLEATDEPARQAWIVDPAGALLARVSTTWEVPSASFHPIAGTHLILREGHLPPALTLLVVAAMLGLDAMLLAEPPLVEP